MKTCYDAIRTLIRTEKATAIESQGKYLFQVARTANKIEIKEAIEEIYKVNVRSVNTTIVPGKKKVVRREQGYTTDWKKAVVTLQKGQKIEIK